MDHKEILRHVDHTLLTQTATWDESARSATTPWSTAPLPSAFRPAM